MSADFAGLTWPACGFEPPAARLRYHAQMGFAMKRAEVGLFLALGLAVLLAYGKVACGPMRLASSTVSDGSVYMATAQWILEGKPAGFRSANSALPLGYPYVIAALESCGLGEHGLFSLHALALILGCATFASVAHKQLVLDKVPVYFAVLLTLASLTCLELTSTVASEVVFFCLSMGCLALLSHETAASIAAASVLCAAAIFVRTAGVALVPAVVYAVAVHPAVNSLSTWRKRTIGIASAVILAALFLAFSSA